jgi:hypothetical protein
LNERLARRFRADGGSRLDLAGVQPVAFDEARIRLARAKQNKPRVLRANRARQEHVEDKDVI